MEYTVKQLSRLAGVSARTLHFYDEIGLLKPASYGENGYRYYGEEALLRLQQILFFKELDFSLAEIRDIVDRPDFDMLRALQSHRSALRERARRVHRLINTVEKTISHLKGEQEMSGKDLYEGFEAKEKSYREEASERWGRETVDNSYRRWNSYTHDQQEAIKAGMGSILQGLADHIADGYDSEPVQQLVAALHRQMGFFYECTFEIFRGLGHHYNEHPDFVAMYKTRYHPDMPEFLERAITYYCDENESAG